MTKEFLLYVAIIVSGQSVRYSLPAADSLINNVAKTYYSQGAFVGIFAEMVDGSMNKMSCATKTDDIVLVEQKLRLSMYSELLHWRVSTELVVPDHLNPKKKRNLKMLDNMQKGYFALENYEKLNGKFFPYIIRTRTDNMFLSPMPYTIPSMHEVHVPNCRHWNGLYDKFAIIGRDAAVSYFSMYRVRNSVPWRNTEGLLKAMLANMTVILLDGASKQISNIAVLEHSYCFRSFENCVEGDHLKMMKACSCSVLCINVRNTCEVL